MLPLHEYDPIQIDPDERRVAKVGSWAERSIIFTQEEDWQVIATLSWIKNTWQFGDSNNITMVDDIQDFPLRRLHDKTIMDTFFAAGFRKGDLQALNRCRLYLKVITIVDVVTGCGKKVSKLAWKGVIDQSWAPLY